MERGLGAGETPQSCKGSHARSMATSIEILAQIVSGCCFFWLIIFFIMQNVW